MKLSIGGLYIEYTKRKFLNSTPVNSLNATLLRFAEGEGGTLKHPAHKEVQGNEILKLFLVNGNIDVSLLRPIYLACMI